MRDGRLNIPFTDNTVHSLGNPVGVVIQAKVTEKHRTRQDHSTWVSLVLALDIQPNVTATRLENGNVTSHVATRNQTRATDQRGTDVGKNTTVQVRHDHDVELLGLGDGLHGRVVNDHVVHIQGRIVLGGLVEGVTEQAVGKLHDVGLVDASDLLPVVGKSKVESKFSNTFGFGTGDDLQRLDHALHGLVFKAGIFTLCVLTDNAEVDVFVTRLVAGDVLNQDNRSVDIKLLAQSNVERLVTRTLDGGEEDTLEAQFVTAK